jgi:hypothetical protein
VRFVVPLLILLSTFPAKGQRGKIIEGYIITAQLDTVSCVFKPRNWAHQPFEIKAKIQGKDSVILPNQIKGFIIPSLNVEYKSKEIYPAKYEVDLQFAEDGYLPDFDTGRVAFLKILYRGKLNLLMYQDKIERKHFYLEIGDEVTEIYSHLYAKAGLWHSSFPVVEWYKQYIPMLKIFMGECKPLFTIIDVMEFKEENIIQLLIKYDKFMSENTEG